MARIPRWGKVLLGIAGVLLILGLSLPYVLNVDRYRPMILSAIEQATGRHATIGTIRARFFPSIGFTLDDVRLASPDGMGGHPLVTIESIHGSLAWGPLLRRRFEVSGVTLTRPVVWLLEDAAGRTNYMFTTPAATGTAASSSTAMADIDAIAITDAEIVAARISDPGAAITPSLRISHVNMTLTNVAFDAARFATWRGTADLKGTSVVLPGVAPVDLESGRLTLADGGVQMEASTSLGRVAKIAATLRMADLAKGPATFDISTPLIDLDQVSSLTESAPVTAPITAAPVRRATPTDELLAEGRITAERIRMAPVEGTAATADVRVFSNHIEIGPLRVALYEGTLAVTARIDRHTDPANLSATIELHGANVAAALLAMNGEDRVSGTADVTLQLNAAMGSGLVESLKGQGHAALSNGVLPGFGTDGMMGAVARLQTAVAFGARGDRLAKEIPYRALTADVAIADRRIRSQRIHLDSSTGTVDAHGSSGFDRALDYNGQAVLLPGRTEPAGKSLTGAISDLFGRVMTKTVGRVKIPFSIRGTMLQPRVVPMIGPLGRPN